MATLDTTAGGTTSNSYVTVAETDAYLAERKADAWQVLPTEERELKLIQATRLIDGFAYLGYKEDTSTSVAGGREGQALQFPRATDTDYAGDVFIAPEVKQATYEVAWLLTVNPDAALEQGPPLTSLKVGEVSAEFRGGQSMIKKIVRQWLGDRMPATIRMG